MEMTEEHARAVLNDHAHALHPDQGDDDCCPHPECDAAYWQVAKADSDHADVFAAAPPGAQDAYDMRSIDDVLASAPRGLPRPRHASGLPVPWIANLADLGDANAFRRAVCVVLRRCQVCGEPLDGGAVVCWRAGDGIVIDGSAVHPAKCWPLALRHCPELARLNASGLLLHAVVPAFALEVVRGDPTTAENGMPLGYAVPGV